MAHDMTLNACKGVVTSTTFDNWWNGGNRSVPFRHNILGILTECASANLGDPVTVDPKRLRGRGIGLPEHVAMMNHPDPWQGGKWGLGEIVRYHREAAWSVFRTMAAMSARSICRARSCSAAVRSLHHSRTACSATASTGEGPQRAAAQRLVGTLQALGVEVTRTEEGSDYYVSLAQPYRSMAKDLLERQALPPRARRTQAAWSPDPAL